MGNQDYIATSNTIHPSGLRNIFRALHNRNYRLFFIGQGISMVGTWMQTVALQWLIYRLTNSPFLLGMVGFLNNIPSLILAPFAGVLADRWNRHCMLIAIQIAALLQAAILGVLILTGHAPVWAILLLAGCLGIIYAFDMPIRQSFIFDMLENRNDLGNAIALNSSLVNGARLIGPSAAGILITAFGEGICFLANAVSYLAVIAALLSMRIRRPAIGKQVGSVIQHFREGARYAWDVKPIRAIIMLFALVNLMAMPYIVLMPIFAREVLHGGPQTLGFLMAAVGVGALIGALVLATRSSAQGLERIIPIAAAFFGSGLVLFSLSRAFPLSLALMLFSGLGMMVNMTSSNTMLQTLADEDKRGRVMSFYAVAFRGVYPLGSLMAGSLATHLGAPITLAIGGATCILGASIFYMHLPKLRTTIASILNR